MLLIEKKVIEESQNAFNKLKIAINHKGCCGNASLISEIVSTEANKIIDSKEVEVVDIESLFALLEKLGKFIPLYMPTEAHKEHNNINLEILNFIKQNKDKGYKLIKIKE